MAKRAASPATTKPAARAPRARAGEQPPEQRPRPVHHEGPVLFGQDAAVATLSHAVRSGHMHHAWILHGAVGVGKFTAAMECARLLLDPEATPAHIDAFKAPRDTRTAELVDASSHPDLHLISKERAEESSIRELRDRKQTNIPLDLLRELMIGGAVGDGRSFDSPVWRGAYFGHNKVFIVDEAELLDPYGQNALLKTLEEPPAGTYIFLVTTLEERLLPTIRSRCQRVAFRTLDPRAMDACFDRLAIPTEERGWLSRFADGAPGTAELAHRHGLKAWSDELLPRLGTVERGQFDAGLADRLAELVGDFAERVVKDNPKASKEAANRLGVRCLLLSVGAHVRESIGRAAAADDTAALAESVRRAGLIAALEGEIRANVNLKHALADLVAQWGAM
ncbi:MAG: ATP-binding protein [Planctomycetota bacterium]